MTRITATMISVLAGAFALVPALGWAAEPGSTNDFPPGVTLGLPIGASPPPGLFFLLGSNFYSADAVDAKGNKTGTHANSFSVTPGFMWVPGVTLFGGQYNFQANVPLVNLNVSGNNTVNQTGPGNPWIAPLNLSWMLSPGIFVSAGSSVYLPAGQQQIRNNFWTFEQSGAVSYLRDGWDLTLHAVYDINTQDSVTKYLTGDRLYLGATATKTFDKFEVGPVAYYDIQTTNDKNNGFAFGPFQPTFGREQKLGLGALVGYDFGAFAVKTYVTQDVYARNTGQGTRVWFDLSLPLWIDKSKLPPGGPGGPGGPGHS